MVASNAPVALTTTSARPVKLSIRRSTPRCVVALETSTPKKIATPRTIPAPVRTERPFLCAKLLEPREDSLRTRFTPFGAVNRGSAILRRSASAQIDPAADPAVLEVDHFVAVRGRSRIVRDDDDRLSL